jgi:hypothetical protein
MIVPKEHMAKHMGWNWGTHKEWIGNTRVTTFQTSIGT